MGWTNECVRLIVRARHMDAAQGVLAFDLSTVEGFSRALLVSDGTVTNLLEAYVGEPIELVPLEQVVTRGSGRFAFLEPADEEAMALRSILLRGSRSKRNYLYAESQIALDRLSDEFRKDLVAGKLPIGRIWAQRRLETYKEMLEMGRRAAKELDRFFRVEADESVLFRTYRVFAERQPIMVITEVFPERGLLNDNLS